MTAMTPITPTATAGRSLPSPKGRARQSANPSADVARSTPPEPAPAVAAPTTRRAPMPSLFHQPAVVVLGRDDRGKPHASWFDEPGAKVATQAALLMGMHALAVSGDALTALATRLPQGRLFASGKAFVPFVKEATYEALAAHLPESAEGLAAEADSDGDGSSGDDGTGAGDDGSSNGSGSGDGSDGGDGASPSPEGRRPTDWSQIEVGSIVLATEGGSDGWYESVVESMRKGDVILLRWRDWPDLPRFTRKRSALALLPPYQP